MRRYFEQFGKVTHCTIMRDPVTDRSRGFGFLTFADASAVNTVMVKEHHLDGKIVSGVTRRSVSPRPQPWSSQKHGAPGRPADSLGVQSLGPPRNDAPQIDPKRAIPRPEVGTTVRNDKIFVRNVPQTMDVHSFKEHFGQFGTIVDGNLMFDRETGMHRGFGFVTYDDPSSAQSALNREHEWQGQLVGVV